MAKLILKFKGTLMKEYPLDKPVIRIGRDSENDIKIETTAVSRHHAKLQKVNGSYIIVDLRSSNGTFVNKKRIKQAKLCNEDEITIGNHTLIFKDGTQIREGKIPAFDAKLQETLLISGEELVFDFQSKAGIETEKFENIAKLNFISELGSPEIMLVKKLTIIGSSKDADIKLKGLFAPKVAALINKAFSKYSIIPSEEKSKVKVNRKPIVKQMELTDGDVIEIGTLKFVFSIP